MIGVKSPELGQYHVGLLSLHCNYWKAHPGLRGPLHYFMAKYKLNFYLTLLELKQSLHLSWKRNIPFRAGILDFLLLTYKIYHLVFRKDKSIPNSPSHCQKDPPALIVISRDHSSS